MTDAQYLNFNLDQNIIRYNNWGWSTFWFNQLCIEGTYPELYTNIQNLKLDPQQAYLLFSHNELNAEINRYLVANLFNEESKYIILTRLYPEKYPGVSFNNITSTSNAPDDPIIDNGITV